jgi:nucleotide-binding universal stress UspA family protein
MPMQRIMVATDGSAGADRAVETAAALAKAVDGELLIVTIGGNFPVEEIRKLARAEGGAGEADELLTNRILLEAKERAERAGARKIAIRSGWGDPAEEITDAARRERSDVLVLGRRGRGQLAGLLLGSVSQDVVSRAPCIVVVVP